MERSMNIMVFVQRLFCCEFTPPDPADPAPIFKIKPELKDFCSNLNYIFP